MSWIEGSVRWRRNADNTGPPRLLGQIGQLGAELLCSRARLTSWLERRPLQPPVLHQAGPVMGIGLFRASHPLSRLQGAMTGWRARGCDAFADIDGDFAMALWDGERGTLVLARGPMSELPLAVIHGPATSRFCSLGAALNEGRAPNFEWLARQQAGAPVFGSRSTFLGGVEVVEPGTAILASADSQERIRFFHAHPRPFSSREEAAARLQEAVDHAVADALADGTLPAAAHLSAGRDSGVVAATAALNVRTRGGRLIALTAVPSSSDRIGPYDSSGNEGPGAEAVARLHAAVTDHRLVSVRGADLGSLLDQRNAYLPGPYGTPVNLPWWDRIQAIVSAEGGRVLLTGSAGNLTVSAGGPWALGDLVANGDLSGWASAIRRARRYPGSSWANLLKNSFSDALPAKVQAFLAKLDQRRQAMHPRGYFLREPLARLVRDMAAEQQVSKERWSEKRCRAIEGNDGSDPTGEILHGVTMRDPTADRRVIEAALSLSPRDLASPYDERPVFARAFADRLPPSTLRPPVRHYQGTDWVTAIDAAALRASLADYSRNPAVSDLLDLGAMHAWLERWPHGQRIDVATSELFTDQLLPAMSIASFVDRHWPA